MPHLLFAEKQHQIMLRNIESRLVRKVHNIISKIEEVEPEKLNKQTRVITPAGGAGPRRRDHPHEYHAEVHAAEASRRPHEVLAVNLIPNRIDTPQ